MAPKLSVLTDPVPSGRHRYSEGFKKWARAFKYLVFPLPEYMRSPYRGHRAVTRSLVEGLRKTGANVNYNPRKLTELGEVVVVLSGIGALKQAIGWKRAGRIKTLLAGPNLVTDPREHGRLVCAPEIDVYLVNSEWTREYYVSACPELAARCKIWPAGVDVDYWRGAPEPQKNGRVLVYQKNGPEKLIQYCTEEMQKRGYEVETIVYGDYQPAEFLEALQSSQLMVAFSQSESQGLALAEAWAVGVPTLVWNKGWLDFNGERISVSSAPFLSDETGLFFYGTEDFCLLFEQWKKLRGQYHTRHWVHENMSDEVCARLFCQLANVKL